MLGKRGNLVVAANLKQELFPVLFVDIFDHALYQFLLATSVKTWVLNAIHLHLLLGTNQVVVC